MTARPEVFLERGWRITSPYGMRRHPVTGSRRMHRGVDLARAHRHPIAAFVSGQVVFAGDGTGHAGFGVEQGIAVAVRDDDGFLHCYLHLDRAVAAVGESVLAGATVVGLQGNTGTLTTGSHLHYEVRKQVAPTWGWGTDVDPGVYLEQWLDSQPSPGAKDARNWAVALGISDGRRPRDSVTREEVWTMLHRARQS